MCIHPRPSPSQTRNHSLHPHAPPSPFPESTHRVNDPTSNTASTSNKERGNKDETEQSEDVQKETQDKRGTHRQPNDDIRHQCRPRHNDKHRLQTRYVGVMRLTLEGIGESRDEAERVSNIGDDLFIALALLGARKYHTDKLENTTCTPF